VRKWVTYLLGPDTKHGSRWDLAQHPQTNADRMLRRLWAQPSVFLDKLTQRKTIEG